jgi:hypothetical protein
MGRTILAAIGAVMLAGLAMTLRPVPALGDWIWCWDDPTLTVNGLTAHINTGVPWDQRSLVTGTSLVVTVPTNVDAQLSGTNAAQGTGILGTTTQLVRSGTYSGVGPVPVFVTAIVNGATGIPVKLSVWQASVGDRGERSGFSPEPVELSSSLQ